MKPVSSQSALRIALVSGGVPMGGSTTFLINFAGELIRRGIPAQVLSFESANPLAADFQGQHIPLTCQDERRMIFEDRARRVLQQLAQFRPTVVVSTLGSISFEVLRYLPKGVFRIGMAQSDDPIVYEMMGHFAPYMDLMVVVSQAMKPRAEAMPAFARVPVACLWYGVPLCADAGLPVRNLAAPLRILYLGRLAREQKRVHLFPEILRHLVASGMPFHWTIAGDGPDRGFLEANLKTEAPQQTVSFAGMVAYARVPSLLQQHDISLLASDYEGLPLSIAEAMGYGLVPVISDLPSGIPDMVNETNGVLIPVADIAGYARAIIHLHEQRDELAAKSAAARGHIKKAFSVAAMTDRWLAVLPPAAGFAGAWPKHGRIQAPLLASNKRYFSPPARVLRRAAAWLRH